MNIQKPLSGATYMLTDGEIDLMKYADESAPSDYFERVVLSQEDLLSLIWLTKLKVL